MLELPHVSMSMTNSSPVKKDRCSVSVGGQTSRRWTKSQLLATQALGFYRGSVPLPHLNFLLPAHESFSNVCRPTLACLFLSNILPGLAPLLCCPSRQSSWKSLWAASPLTPFLSWLYCSSLLLSLPTARSLAYGASGFQFHLFV